MKQELQMLAVEGYLQVMTKSLSKAKKEHDQLIHLVRSLVKDRERMQRKIAELREHKQELVEESERYRNWLYELRDEFFNV